MHEIPYQAMLFEVTEPQPDHLHYATTNSVAVKIGMTAKGVASRMKRDRQFKGHIVIFERPAPADCEVHIVGGKKKCDWEVSWEGAFAMDRLPASEQYRCTASVITALRFMAGQDPKATATIDWIRRYGIGETA